MPSGKPGRGTGAITFEAPRTWAGVGVGVRPSASSAATRERNCLMLIGFPSCLLQHEEPLVFMRGPISLGHQHLSSDRNDKESSIMWGTKIWDVRKITEADPMRDRGS